MNISACDRLAQMRREIEATYKLAAQSHEEALAAIDRVNEIIEESRLPPINSTDSDNDDVINRVNRLIDEAVPLQN
jgi:hypothetical protein